jgi:ribosome maturation factor RimP
MIDKQKIRELVLSEINKNNIVLVDLQVNSGNLIKLTLDSIKGVNIDDCVKISKLIESNFDRETEDYELEVSSYGISQPFILPLHYQKNLEKKVEVYLKQGKSLKGILKNINVENDNLNYIELLLNKKVQIEGKKRKQEVEEIIRISGLDIQKAKLILEY